MKIVYMGTPDFAVAPLEALLAAGHTVTAVVTQPDKPKGRSGKLQMSPVKECALQHDIPVLQPIKSAVLNNGYFSDEISVATKYDTCQ